jgi:hypothetical protein
MNIHHDGEERCNFEQPRVSNDFMSCILSSPAAARFNFLKPSLASCLGFIIDGDLAIKWEEHLRPAKDCSVEIHFQLPAYVC